MAEQGGGGSQYCVVRYDSPLRFASLRLANHLPHSWGRKMRCATPVRTVDAIWYRLYQDYFMGSRLSEYRAMLERLRTWGYRFETVSDFFPAAQRGERKGEFVCLLRIDVDTDPQGAAAMFVVEQDLGIRATYYFRRSTMDAKLARRIADYGSEVGYHFEEIASFAKRHGLRTREEAQANFKPMQDWFDLNLREFAKKMGLSPRSVAAHGDFANRRFNLSNSALLTPELMREAGLLVHTSQPHFTRHLVARYADAPAPRWWQPSDPSLIPPRGPIMILVHPRQWRCNRTENFRVSAHRIGDEIAWAVRRATNPRSVAPASPGNGPPLP